MLDDPNPILLVARLMHEVIKSDCLRLHVHGLGSRGNDDDDDAGFSSFLNRNIFTWTSLILVGVGRPPVLDYN